ncbi:MoxR family ATPase [Rheinheimera sp. MMS21-TC3]|uniref:AAA family ATPase n=1 Tax=Rheinheimera sp. MMS21-TC3 TaxID=3072790 RepID=UPI0028C38112|nr:MoxR family ATPase [Rheinheimera sp. MMS21-TC3]WNO61125.1 MoxR family ATPase [Rheinheimera sp. MMS21-TC3]
MLIALHKVEQNLNQVILGKPQQIRLALCCLLAEGHLLLEDLPGMGKTTLAHALANSLSLTYRRVQFTSDLLPADLTGINIYDARSQEFRFQPGPVFSQVLLADEINRASAKTQSALLEAMEEKQVSIDGETRALPQPFFVIATQNPLFHAGTSALPESQLDRFMFRISLGFPDHASEHQLLKQETTAPLTKLVEQLTVEQVRQLQRQVSQVTAANVLIDYLLALVTASRQRTDLHPLSPRASKAILRAAKAYAFINGRDYVSAEDVQQVFPYIAEHRLNPRSDARELIFSQQLLQQTPCLI